MVKLFEIRELINSVKSYIYTCKKEYIIITLKPHFPLYLSLKTK